MENKEFEDALRQDINIEIRQQIIKCFKVYGIEGTLEKIESLYKLMPKLKELFLNEYNNIIKGQ